MAQMASSPAVALSPRQRAALDALVGDLQRIFGARLGSVLAYGLERGADDDDELLNALALVEAITFEDLSRMVPLAPAWRKAGLAIPLVLTKDEFIRTLDVFPLEYGNIIASHVVITGENPFAGVHVADADRRRGCELEAKSHVIHLREGFLDTRGDARTIAGLIAASAPAFRTVLANIVRLERGSSFHQHALDDASLARQAEETIGIPAGVVRDVLSSGRTSTAAADPSALLARYIEASERVWRFVDGWKA
jgi:hypothetical protein